MEIVKREEKVEVKGVKLEVVLSYYYDKENDIYYDDEELGNDNLKTIRNAYRKKVGLLEDTEIKRIRSLYNLNQRNFSLLLGFGEVTITRYESKSIQEKAHDIIIRNALDPSYFFDCAQKNKELYLKYNSIESYNNLISLIRNKIKGDLLLTGNIEYNEEKFLAVINYYMRKTKSINKTKLAKYLWYADFLSFKEYNKSIMGLEYIHNYYGAYPVGYNDKLSNDNIIVSTEYYEKYDTYVYKIKSCKSVIELSDEEKNIVDIVFNRFNNYSTKELVDYMHEEKAYKNTKNNEIISYDYAKTLSLSIKN